MSQAKQQDDGQKYYDTHSAGTEWGYRARAGGREARSRADPWGATRARGPTERAHLDAIGVNRP